MRQMKKETRNRPQRLNFDVPVGILDSPDSTNSTRSRQRPSSPLNPRKRIKLSAAAVHLSDPSSNTEESESSSSDQERPRGRRTKKRHGKKKKRSRDRSVKGKWRQRNEKKDQTDIGRLRLFKAPKYGKEADNKLL
jgi:hypothetical protein